jgi:hypothetical protein
MPSILFLLFITAYFLGVINYPKTIKFRAESFLSDIPHWLCPSDSILTALDTAILLMSQCLSKTCNEVLSLGYILIYYQANRHKDDVFIKVVQLRVSEAINLDDIKKDLSRLNSLRVLLYRPFVVKSPQTSFIGRMNESDVAWPSCDVVCNDYTFRSSKNWVLQILITEHVM